MVTSWICQLIYLKNLINIRINENERKSLAQFPDPTQDW